MSTEITSKINKLLTLLPSGVVFTSKWLSEQGYSPELLRRYRHSRWLESIGMGAMIRTDDDVDYLGAVCALQQQLGFSVHPAGKTALSLLGKSHYLQMASTEAVLFGNSKELLPSWFKNYDWRLKIKYYTSSFLPLETGIQRLEKNNYFVNISTPARALMECLYLVPHEQELMECLELMQGLNNLPPIAVQQLLEHCTSVKVKRLFLYLAEKAGHSWFKYLNIENIDLGKGKRSLANNGIYIDKYGITVPKELERNEYPEL